jgi:hypothetical protein
LVGYYVWHRYDEFNLTVDRENFYFSQQFNASALSVHKEVTCS